MQKWKSVDTGSDQGFPPVQCQALSWSKLLACGESVHKDTTQGNNIIKVYIKNMSKGVSANTTPLGTQPWMNQEG